jgi:hypothetical protein
MLGRSGASCASAPGRLAARAADAVVEPIVCRLAAGIRPAEERR